jgi:7-keto-8-aminopelargonate synthetase-like enzyme
VVIVPGNAEVRALAERLQQAGLDIRPILYPTVPKGGERLRIVIHSFNTSDEIDRLTALLQAVVRAEGGGSPGAVCSFAAAMTKKPAQP